MLHDILIVGAGVAGLTAARRLHEAGREVIVVEERPRVGGRTWSPEVGGMAADMGATWVWDSERAVLELIEELGLTMFRIDDSGDDLSDAGPSPQRVRAPRSAVPERRITGGTAAIARSIAQDLPDIRLGCRARAIRPCADGVRVDVGDEVLDARHLVVALPPSLLGAQIDIDGIDDETLSRLARTPVWMGDIAKVVAIYDDRFWREDGLSGRAFSRRGPMVEIHDMSGPPASNTAALFGFVPRENAQTPDWRQAARDQFARLFGERAANPLAFRAHAWWEEATTLPEDAPTPVDRLFGHALLRRPFLDGRLHLAASETAAVSTGHINGAVARANEVAKAIVEQAK